MDLSHPTIDEEIWEFEGANHDNETGSSDYKTDVYNIEIEEIVDIRCDIRFNFSSSGGEGWRWTIDGLCLSSVILNCSKTFYMQIGE